MPYGIITDSQLEKLRKYVSNKHVYDLGTGDGGYSLKLLELGTRHVYAIDKDVTYIKYSLDILGIAFDKSKLSIFQSHFENLNIDDIDVAFLSWPVNCYIRGLIEVLQKSKIVIYLGKNTNGNMCGWSGLFNYFLTRELLEYDSVRTNTLMIYGNHIEKRNSSLQEEIALLSSKVLDYDPNLNIFVQNAPLNVAENSKNWLRICFKIKVNDYRPIVFPPPGPYWCSGEGEDYAILIAYVKTEKELLDFWPEAYELDSQKVDKIEFTERFSCPDWWTNHS